MTDHRLYVDKYVPNSLSETIINHEPATQLIACSKALNTPHLIIKGGEGSGRKTFANLYIKSRYNIADLNNKFQMIEIKNGSKPIELQMLYSDYHYQIDPSIHGVHDRLIVQGFIKDILQTKPISRAPYHIIIVNNADHLTQEAQQSLRRTLEKNMANSRFIFIINQDSSLIEALMSRCIQIRLAAPNNGEILSVLEHICRSEKISYTKDKLTQIVDMSSRNMSKAINLLQYIHINYSNVSVIDPRKISTNDNYIYDVAQEIIYANSPQQVIGIRTNINDLLVQCMDPPKILKSLFYVIFDHLESTGEKDQKDQKDRKKHKLIQLLSTYENTLKQGSKPIYHLECFAVAVINLLNDYVS
jgi:replication factor C subunit 3/5